jgi:hypothetical protein
LALDGGTWSAPGNEPLLPIEREAKLAPTAGLEAAVKGKIPAFAGNGIVTPLARPFLSPVPQPKEQNVTRLTLSWGISVVYYSNIRQGKNWSKHKYEKYRVTTKTLLDFKWL